MFTLRIIRDRKWDLRLAWDLFMVLIATLNLALILFDFTYLLLRPFYLSQIPALTAFYDPVLGIEPHPLTEELRRHSNRLADILDSNVDSGELHLHLERTRNLTYRVIRDNPFFRSDRPYRNEIIKELVRTEVNGISWNGQNQDPWKEAVDRFWTDDDPDILKSRVEAFESQVGPLLKFNYYRKVNSYGALVDFFWLIDLPFLLIFWIEFGTRWILSARRGEYSRWYVFPVVYWYDLIGLIPLAQFRIFRLFRAVSIYMRLHRSELSQVGNEFVSRTVKRVSGIIIEELTDAVVLRILDEVKDEIQQGTATRMLDKILSENRFRIEQMVSSQIRFLLTSQENQERLQAAIRLAFDSVVQSSGTLSRFSRPRLLARLLGMAGDRVSEKIPEVLKSLESEEGEKITRELVDGVMDHFLKGPVRQEIDSMCNQLGLEVVENMKERVAFKKWVKPHPRKPDPETS